MLSALTARPRRIPRSCMASSQMSFSASFRRLCHMPVRDVAAMAPHAVLVDIDAQAGAVGYFHMSALGANGAPCHILAQPLGRWGEAPGELRQRRREVQPGSAGNARLAGLAGDIDRHA